MSGTVCTVQPAGYPPVHESAADAVRLVQIKALQAQAPFGTDPKTKKPITSMQYTNAMTAQTRAASAIDLRWPFWVALGAGSLGIVVLLAKR